jgi:nicotinate-nucleotide adenylyltransferase
MKIGLFGGTFDPIHWGHLRSAEEVRESLSLDRVVFIPAAKPPHKQKRPEASAQDRLAMVRLALAGNPYFALSTVEIDRPGKSYSIDTLNYFADHKGPGDELYFILGYDAFRDIGEWKDFREIFPLCHVVVTSRPGSNSAFSSDGMPVAVGKLFCYDPRRKAYRHQRGTYLSFLKITDIAISASDIRERVREGRSVRYLVPSRIDSYIRRRRLYREAEARRKRQTAK